MKALWLFSLLYSAAPIPMQGPLPFRISMNVDFVELEATVRDQKGFFVSGLKEGDFEVYENGAKQSLRVFRHEDTPVIAGLIVDHSGSMGRKLGDVIAAAGSFVRASNPADKMFVVNFNEHVFFGLPTDIALSSKPEELVKAISDAPAQGKTALYDALAKGMERLGKLGQGKKVLVLISDGGDNASKHSLVNVLRMAGQSTAAIYTIGIFDEEDPDRNPDVLRKLARSTGGEAFFPKETSEVPAICEQIAKDIRNQYTLGYASSNAAKPGTQRTIRVVARNASGKKLTVRTRSGYITAGEAQEK